MKRPILLIFILFFVSFFFLAHGQQKVIPPPESDRTSSNSNRDIIKYLARVEVGLGYGQYTEKNQMGEFVLSGLAFPMDVQIGIGIFPKTYIHGAFGVTLMNRPTYTFDNYTYTYEGTLGMFDLGIGFTVYPFPQKIYASATIYGTSTSIFAGSNVTTSKIGAAFNLKGGIDFMLGNVFSVGASAFLYYAGMKYQSDDTIDQSQINNLVLGICLTTTLGNL